MKGSFTSSGTQNLTMSSGTQKIPFDAEEFDIDNEYDTSTHTYTAKNTGIYSIWIQTKALGTVTTGIDFGIGILKNGTLIAKNSFASVGIDVLLTTVNVTPPFRNTTTLVQMTAGDQITFNVYYGTVAATVGLSGSNTESFFTIEQVR